MAANKPSLDEIFSQPQARPSLDEIFTQPAAPADSGMLGTAVKGAAQAFTGGFADELDAALTSKGLNPFSAQMPYEQKLPLNRGQDKVDAATNPISDAAGFIGGNVAGVTALATKFPQVAGAITNVASRGLIPAAAASAGTGAVSGAVYGFGGGEGDFGNRVENAVDSGIVGGIAGPVGAAAGRVVGYGLRKTEPVWGPLTQRAAKLFSKPAAAPAAVQPAAVQGISRSPVAKPLAVDAATTQGSVIPLTKGQSTQSPQLQALENMGRSGAIDDAAQSAVLQADYKQQDAIKNVIKQVAGGDVAEDGLAKAGNTLKSGYKSMKADVSKAYDDAAAIRSVFVAKKPIAESFLPRVKDVAYKQGFDLSNMSGDTQKLIQQVDEIKDPKITAVNLEKMEFWRRKISNRAEQLKGDPEGTMLGKVLSSYDEFMGKLPEGALKAGDEQALKAINEARTLRRRQGVLFERDKVVSKIVKNDELTNEELANLVLTGSERGQNIGPGAGRYVRAMKRAAGENAEAVVSGIRQGALAKVLKNAEINVQQAGTDIQMLSPAKLVKGLDAILSNKSFMNEVFDETGRNTMMALRNDLKKVASDQPGAKNYSNTAYTVINYMRKLPFGLSSLSGAADLVLKPVGDKAARDTLDQSLSEVLGKARDELAGKARLYGAAASGGYSGKRKEPLKIKLDGPSGVEK